MDKARSEIHAQSKHTSHYYRNRQQNENIYNNKYALHAVPIKIMSENDQKKAFSFYLIPGLLQFTI